MPSTGLPSLPPSLLGRTLVVLGSTAALVGCGTTTTTETSGEPEPAAVRFIDPASGDGPQCVSFGDRADSWIPLLVETEGVMLREPRGCVGLTDCGHLQLYVDGLFNNQGASLAMHLRLGRLSDPIHDGSIHAATGEPDVLHAEVFLVDRTGEPLLDADGEPASDSLELITVPDCSALAE